MAASCGCAGGSQGTNLPGAHAPEAVCAVESERQIESWIDPFNTRPLRGCTYLIGSPVTPSVTPRPKSRVGSRRRRHGNGCGSAVPVNGWLMPAIAYRARTYDTATNNP